MRPFSFYITNCLVRFLRALTENKNPFFTTSVFDAIKGVSSMVPVLCWLHTFSPSKPAQILCIFYFSFPCPNWVSSAFAGISRSIECEYCIAKNIQCVITLPWLGTLSHGSADFSASQQPKYLLWFPEGFCSPDWAWFLFSCSYTALSYSAEGWGRCT